MARDWLKSLWPGSYKGSRFWTDSDHENGGRRIVSHQFPMRDDPFHEDLGEDLREFEVTAYLASDRADSEATILSAACSSRGAGLLVLPHQGPVMVRCVAFARDRSKDKLGYIGFNLRCRREGAASALQSVHMLANLVFVAAEVAAIAAATSFAARVLSTGWQDYVVNAAISGVEDAVATLEAVRVAEPVNVTASAVHRDKISDLFAQLPVLMSDPETMVDAASGVVSIARALGDSMSAISGIRAFYEVINANGPSDDAGRSLGRRAMHANEQLARRLLRLSCMIAYCESVARVELKDRPSAITLRANVVEVFDTETDYLTADESELVRDLAGMRDATVSYLSRAIIDLAPVIKLSANRSMPSLYWAHRLYQDPSRASELVDRNKVRHPSFIPTDFEALAR